MGSLGQRASRRKRGSAWVQSQETHLRPESLRARRRSEIDRYALARRRARDWRRRTGTGERAALLGEVVVVSHARVNLRVHVPAHRALGEALLRLLDLAE